MAIENFDFPTVNDNPIFSFSTKQSFNANLRMFTNRPFFEQGENRFSYIKMVLFFHADFVNKLLILTSTFSTMVVFDCHF